MNTRRSDLTSRDRNLLGSPFSHTHTPLPNFVYIFPVYRLRGPESDEYRSFIIGILVDKRSIADPLVTNIGWGGCDVKRRGGILRIALNAGVSRWSYSSFVFFSVVVNVLVFWCS